MTARKILLIMILGLAVNSEFANAKGKTVEVTVTGPGLEMPLHLSSDDITAANVWTGNFADWDAGPVEPVLPETAWYQLHFWVQFAPDDVQMKYVVRYLWDAESDRGIICLPGPRNIWYRGNTYSILRSGQDGKCFIAEQRWGDAIQSALT